MSIATRTDTQSPALHAADGYDLIRVHVVFGTIAAESQRLINETYSAFVQGFMPTLARPEVGRPRGRPLHPHRRAPSGLRRRLTGVEQARCATISR
jgi:hypothetical protein